MYFTLNCAVFVNYINDLNQHLVTRERKGSTYSRILDSESSVINISKNSDTFELNIERKVYNFSSIRLTGLAQDRNRCLQI